MIWSMGQEVDEMKIMKSTYFGAGGSIFTSLCCLGTPALLAFLSAIGLGFVINDFILFPLLGVFLTISIYASFIHKKQHKNKSPFAITLASSILLIPAIFINKYFAYLVIAALVFASIWDIILMRRCGCEVK